MIEIQGVIKKHETLPEKLDSEGNIKTPKRIRITMEAEYGDLTDAEFANMALASANENLIDFSLNPKQLVMEIT